ncbi:MAG: amidohydrolase [Gemmatimonadaceae bacterium]|nr:amidohydrolase [Gloeobacterales cyanobacterium ES-bin-141]
MKFALLLLLGLLCIELPVRAESLHAELVLINGRLWTGVETQPWAQALAIREHKIIAVGTDAQIKTLVDQSTEVIDLGGRLASPGFNDAHIHFLGGSLGLDEVDLTGARSLQAIQARVVAYAKNHPDRAWIYGRGWEYAYLPGKRLPTRQDLDAVIADRPVYLRAYDGHTGWANTRAIALAKITSTTKVEGIGEIVRDPKTGLPTGVFKEDAGGLIGRLIPAPTPEQEFAALKKGMKLLASLGITSIQNASGSPQEVSLYETMLQKGELTVRTSVAFSVDGRESLKDLETWKKLKAKYTRNPMLQVGAVKFSLDGVIESHTAAMLTAYTDLPQQKGTPAYTQSEYNDLVGQYTQAGFQIYTHAIGDRGVRMALDGYEYAKSVAPKRDPRFRIEHIEVVSPEDIPRFVRIGVMPSMEPIHADPGTIEVWSKAVGPERLHRAFAWAELLNSGAHLVLSSDWPAAISLDPLRGLHNAVNRRTIEGDPPGGWVPEQRLTLDQALRGYTSAGAYASFEEKTKGQLAPGMWADVIVLSQDLFKIPTIDIHKTRVVLTIFDGKVLYRR